MSQQFDFQPGALDRQITLQAPTYTKDGTGQDVVSWTSVATVWAHARQLRAKEQVSGSDEVQSEQVLFTVRWYSGLANTWQLLYEGRQYRIIGAPREIGRRHWQQITAEHVGVYTSA